MHHKVHVFCGHYIKSIRMIVNIFFVRCINFLFIFYIYYVVGCGMLSIIKNFAKQITVFKPPQTPPVAQTGRSLSPR